MSDASVDLCPHLSECSGCPRMHQPYAEQLGDKRERLASLLRRFEETQTLEVPPVLGAQPLTLGYRTRVKWMVGPRGELGLYARGGGHRVLDLPGCVIAEPALLSVGRALRELAGEAGFAATFGKLRAVDLRAVSTPDLSGVLVTLVAERGKLSTHAARAFAHRLRERCELVFGVALSESEPDAIQVLGASQEPLDGLTEARDQLGETVVIATFGSFVQAHRSQAARLAERVLALAGPSTSGLRVLELFAGSGALGFALARLGASLCAVESFAPAAERIGRAAAAMGLEVEAHAEDASRFVTEAARGGRRFDFVLVDPPRRGLEPKLRRALAQLAPAALLYVSCRPETAARDLAHLSRLGFVIESIEALDMMPHTEELECVARLRFAGPSALASTGEGEAHWLELRAHERTPRSAGLSPCDGGSGLLTRRGQDGRARFGAVLLVRGVTRKKGTLRKRLSYRRLAVAAGHSLLWIEGQEGGERVARWLSEINHPVVGHQSAGPKTNRYLYDKHGLDRAAWHTVLLAQGTHPVRSSVLAADLVLVLTSLGFAVDGLTLPTSLSATREVSAQ